MGGSQPRAGSEQLLTQGTRTVGRFEYTAFLQFGNYPTDETFDTLRRHAPNEVETIDIRFLLPGTQFIGHCAAIADDREYSGAQGH